MTEEMKTRLKELTDKGETLTDTEKAELNLLKTIDKMAKQISDKDAYIGTKTTELDTLKRDHAAATGEDKLKLEQQVADKQEAIDTLKAGIDALKEAKTISESLAGKISHKDSGNGVSVDQKEIEVLEKKAFASEDANKKVVAAYAELSPEEKTRYRTDLVFKKQCLESALGVSGSENTDDSPWSSAVENVGAPSDEDKEVEIRNLFAGQQRTHRQGPPGSSGRQGGPGRFNSEGKPKAAEREADERTN